MTLVLRYAARSDRGLVRSNNQDSVYAGPRLLAVADGMGGHAAGEVASKVVIAALAPLDDDEPGDDLLGQLRESVAGGNSAIAELVAADSELEGMGTTLTAILFSGNRLGLLHIGDSRAYLWRDGKLTQMTHDDSFVQKLQDEGRITEEEAESHPQKSLLLKALTGHEVEPSLTIREARAGDRYLLCSDGLSGMVSKETLEEAIQIPDPQECADRMIELALKGGGTDNVTVIVADVVDVDYGDDAPIVGGAAGDGTDEAPRLDSPAARAHALTSPPPPPPQPLQLEEPPDPRAKRRKRWKLLFGLATAIVVLAAAAITTRYFVIQQYYVGIHDGEVSIFRGIQGDILGVELSSLEQRSCGPADGPACEPLMAADLEENVQDLLRSGVKRQSLDEARTYIHTLRTKFVKDCVPPEDGTGDPSGSGIKPPDSATNAPGDSGQKGSDGGRNHANGQTQAPAAPTQRCPDDGGGG
ncbi:PP2C family serine/threonine-protein phosphatase [Thermocrispum sp.]|uniref:PP2C family protein-serine/threonine phosphatase n=1 Tax=Thermocrispum sp. TaxID=2060768 RepID=UPI00257D4F3D|nr:PP2C family serine/threonine-protein phosphatase [Thermocrispum sp.]